MNQRRTFLKASALISMSPLVPGFIDRTAGGDEPDVDKPIIVVVEMNGGNDGLNTVIPYGQRGYRKVRPTIRIDKDRLLGIDDEVGLNPAMVGFKELYDDGKLAIVNSVGYPNPCLLYTSPSPRDQRGSRMPSSA